MNPNDKRAVLIEPDGSVKMAWITDSPHTSELKQTQHFVGGYIEAVRHNQPNMTAFCDEDGQAKNLPYNMLASSFFNTHIVGNVLVLGPTDSSGDTSGLTPDQTRIFLTPEGEATLNELIQSNDESGMDFVEDAFGGELP